MLENLEKIGGCKASELSRISILALENLESVVGYKTTQSKYTIVNSLRTLRFLHGENPKTKE